MGPFELILDPTVVPCQAQASYGLILDLTIVFQILGGRLKSNVQYMTGESIGHLLKEVSCSDSGKGLLENLKTTNFPVILGHKNYKCLR